MQETTAHFSPRLLRLEEVERFTGLGRSQIFEHVAGGRFPRPIKVIAGGRAIAWLEEELLQWRAERIAERDRQRELAV